MFLKFCVEIMYFFENVTKTVFSTLDKKLWRLGNPWILLQDCLKRLPGVEERATLKVLIRKSRQQGHSLWWWLSSIMIQLELEGLQLEFEGLQLLPRKKKENLQGAKLLGGLQWYKLECEDSQVNVRFASERLTLLETHQELIATDYVRCRKKIFKNL